MPLPITLEAESTLTDRFQTTVPEPVRRVLRLGKRDRIRYLVLGDGTVNMQRVSADSADQDDPVLGEFLAFLARDVRLNPEHLQTFGPDLKTHLGQLVGHVDVDLDEALSPDDE